MSLYRWFEKFKANKNYRYLLTFSTITSSFDLNFKGLIFPSFLLIGDLPSTKILSSFLFFDFYNSSEFTILLFLAEFVEVAMFLL